MSIFLRVLALIASLVALAIGVLLVVAAPTSNYRDWVAAAIIAAGVAGTAVGLLLVMGAELLARRTKTI
jgi:hypothetical protein